MTAGDVQVGVGEPALPSVVGAAPAGRRRFAAVAAVVAAAGLLASLGLAALGPDTADAATVLASHSGGVDAVLADGSTVVVADGQEVPRGATVRTGAAGAATLVTRGREVLLGADTHVTVVDGARQVLERGLVLVDASDAPGVRLDGDAADVAVAGGALARVERGRAALRVAVFEGKTTVRSADRSGSRTVRELFQVRVPYGGLTGTTTPLVLTNDTWEQRYALDLVQDDKALRALASGLDAEGSEAEAVLAVAPAAVREDVTRGTPRSEQLLGYLLASDATRGGDTLQQRFTTVRGYRSDGGSWGVVAALVGSGADGASRTLDAVLSPDLQALPDPGDGTIDPGGLLGVPPTGGPAPTTGPSRRPPGGPTSRPPTSDPPTGEPDPVDAVVDTVLDLIPVPVPTPTPTPLLSTDGPVGAVVGSLTGR